jgi:autotransporter passenger strand-loop-strand repeat protein
VSGGGVEVVASGGTAVGTLIDSGGIEVISSGGVTSSDFIASGGEVVVSNGGLQSGAILGSNWFAPPGMVGAGTVVVASGGTTVGDLVSSGGREVVQSGGLAENTGLFGGTLEVASGGSATNVSFAGLLGEELPGGPPSELVLDASTSFHGTIAEFGFSGEADQIDLRDIAFGTTKGFQLSFKAAPLTSSGPGGTLTVTDGVHTANIELLGNYAASQFVAAADGRLAQIWQDFHQARLSVTRLGDILNTRPEPIYQTGRTVLPPIRGEVTFEHVAFRYQIDGQQVLHDINFQVPAGQVVGVIGPSGSGKSTLTKLIQRLYVPERGRVLIDGIDLSVIDPSWLRRQIGVVLQESVLFNCSVRDNIALADRSMPIEKVIAAAQVAGAHDFILELPMVTTLSLASGARACRAASVSAWRSPAPSSAIRAF